MCNGFKSYWIFWNKTGNWSLSLYIFCNIVLIKSHFENFSQNTNPTKKIFNFTVRPSHKFEKIHNFFVISDNFSHYSFVFSLFLWLLHFFCVLLMFLICNLFLYRALYQIWGENIWKMGIFMSHSMAGSRKNLCFVVNNRRIESETGGDTFFGDFGKDVQKML